MSGGAKRIAAEMKVDLTEEQKLMLIHKLKKLMILKISKLPGGLLVAEVDKDSTGKLRYA
jgi:hypothetical protein